MKLKLHPFQFTTNLEVNVSVLTPHFYLPKYYTAITFPTAADYSPAKNRKSSIVAELKSIYDANHLHLIPIPPESQPINPTFEPLLRKEYKKFVLGSIDSFLETKFNNFKTQFANY